MNAVFFNQPQAQWTRVLFHRREFRPINECNGGQKSRACEDTDPREETSILAVLNDPGVKMKSKYLYV